MYNPDFADVQRTMLFLSIILSSDCSYVSLYSDIFCIFVLFFLSSGARFIHNELHNVHFLGFELCLLSSVSGEGVCSVCLWLWDSRGEVEVIITLQMFHVSVKIPAVLQSQREVKREGFVT